MRRTGLLALMVAVLGVLVGCAGGKAAPAGTAVEIADKVFAEAGVEPFGPYKSLETDEDKEFYLGSTDYPAFSDSVAVLPMISIDTRVLVVLRAADQGSVKDIEDKLADNIDPNRLVCVTFSLEDVAIESRGDVVLLTINTDAAQRTALVEAFQNID